MTNQDPFKHKTTDPQNNGSTLMTVNGLHCTFNMPDAVQRQQVGGQEPVLGLPPYNPRIAYPVDEFVDAPDTWMHGSGKAGSYFVPILPEHGMWLDFTQNMHHSHYVAVVVSVQGINPLTGLKTDPIRLEQYREKCPKHNIDFEQNLYCSSCKFKWHPQNYLASNTHTALWLDGFRTEDGVIRQWYFTEQECKGVAAQLIGKERVFAIGVAFYLSKQPKPVAPVNQYHYSWHAPWYWQDYEMTLSATNSLGGGSFCSTGGGSFGSSSLRGFKGFTSSPASPKLGSRTKSAGNLGRINSVQTPTYEIGAGAKIRQEVGVDPEKLDFWQDEPSGFLYINYCDVNTAQQIIAGERKPVEAEGFLTGLDIKD